MKRHKKQPAVVFYDGVAHKAGEAPDDALTEELLVSRWARRMLRQRACGSSWFTIRLRTWFELGMDDARLLGLMEQRAQRAFQVALQSMRGAAIKKPLASEG